MKFKKIVGFGDSWVWGDELLDPILRNTDDAFVTSHRNSYYRESNCFLGLLGNHYGVPVENISWPGSSLQSIIWCYLWWINHTTDINDTLILVGHTHSVRHSFYNPTHQHYDNDPPWNKFVHDSWIHSDGSMYSSDWVNLVKQHTTLTECEELYRLRYQQSVLFFEGQRLMTSGNLLQFCSLDPPMHISSVPSLLWPNTCLDNFLERNSDLRYAGGHPTELGHNIIHNRLISEIDRVIING